MTTKLLVNGVRVPIDSCTEQYVQVYGDTVAYTGGARKNRLGNPKRIWQVKTPLMYIEEATSLAGIIQSRGDTWTFDDLTLFSQKGAASGWAGATAVTPFVINSAAADGAYNPESPPFGAYAIYTGTGAANSMTPATDSTMEGAGAPVSLILAGGGAFGSSVALSTTRKYQGSKSLLFTGSTSGSQGQGIKSNTYTGTTPGFPLVLSLMIYNGGASPCPIVLSMTQPAGTLLGTAQSITVPVGGWHRYVVRASVPSPTSWQWRVVEAAANQGTLLYIDAVMLQPSTGFASPDSVPSTPWVAPGVTPIAASASYPIELYPDTALPGGPRVEAQTGELSVVMWAQMGGFDRSQRFLVEGLSAGSASFAVYASDNRALNAYVVNEDAQVAVSSGAIWPASALISDWHMFVFNLYSHPHAGGAWLELYIDGVRTFHYAASVRPYAPMPHLGVFNRLKLRTDTDNWNGLIGEVQLNHYCLTQSVITQLYATQPTVRPTHPNLVVGGTLVGGGTANAVGGKVSIDPLVAVGTGGRGAGLQTLATLSFALEEV